MPSPVTIVRSAPEDLFDVRVRQDGGSRFVGTMPWSGPVTSPSGDPAVGALGVLVDEVLGYSLIASLPPGSWTISTEIWVDLVAPLPPAGAPSGALAAVGDTLQVGSYAAGQVRDQDGRLVALTRQRGRRVPAGPPAGAPTAPVVVPVLAPEGGLAEALGARRTEGARVVLEPSSTLANPLGVVHGGISFAASELAASLDREEQGSALRTSSVHIAHLRAAPVDEPFELWVETVHRGRGLWVSDVRGVVAGRLCTAARVTAE